MLNAKSGLVDFLKPNAGMVADKRQGNSAQDDDGLFGDTLRGQMKQGTDAGKAPAASRQTAAAAPQSKDSAAPEPETDAPASAAAETAEEAATDAGAEDEAAALLAVPVPQQIVEVEEETLDADAGALAEAEQAEQVAETVGAVASGKELPAALPLLAASAEGEEVLPRWLRLQGLERAAANPTAASNLQQAATAVTEGAEPPPLEEDFLQGLRAAFGQRAGEGEAQPDEGTAKALGEGALFKLAGMSATRELPLSTTGNPALAGTTPGAATTPTGASQLPQLAVDTPLRQTGWDQAMAERVVWLARQGLKQAEIQLNPRHLGPIEVHVSVDKDQASVTFMAQHAVTREALEAALPRLREMLQGNGLNLAQSEVSQHSFGQQQREAMGFAAGEHGRRSREDAEMGEQGDALIGETTLESGAGLSAVDYYA